MDHLAGAGSPRADQVILTLDGRPTGEYRLKFYSSG